MDSIETESLGQNGSMKMTAASSPALSHEADPIFLNRVECSAVITIEGTMKAKSAAGNGTFQVQDVRPSGPQGANQGSLQQLFVDVSIVTDGSLQRRLLGEYLAAVNNRIWFHRFESRFSSYERQRESV